MSLQKVSDTDLNSRNNYIVVSSGFSFLVRILFHFAVFFFFIVFFQKKKNLFNIDILGT
jgi:hypothetical protein